jgi:hypothetical protein
MAVNAQILKIAFLKQAEVGMSIKEMSCKGGLS